jgi:hypothetical protein
MVESSNLNMLLFLINLAVNRNQFSKEGTLGASFKDLDRETGPFRCEIQWFRHLAPQLDEYCDLVYPIQVGDVECGIWNAAKRYSFGRSRLSMQSVDGECGANKSCRCLARRSPLGMSWKSGNK